MGACQRNALRRESPWTRPPQTRRAPPPLAGEGWRGGPPQPARVKLRQNRQRNPSDKINPRAGPGLPNGTRAVAAGRPHSATLPAAVGIIDAPIHALGEEAHGIRNHQVDHLAVFEGDQRIVLVAGRERHILAEPERVVLIDPGVVARLTGARLNEPIFGRGPFVMNTEAEIRQGFLEFGSGRFGTIERS